MKAIFSIIILTFSSSILVGQEITDSLLADFYNRTLAQHFTDSANKSAIETGPEYGFKEVIVITGFDYNNLTNTFGNIKLHFVDTNTALQTELKKPLKKNDGRVYYRISHSMLGTDTIDVLLSMGRLGDVKRKSVTFTANCGGTLGYVPESRFVFVRETKTWAFFSHSQLQNKKHEEEDRMIRQIQEKNNKTAPNNG